SLRSAATGHNTPNAKAMIYGKGQNIISWISLTDVAKFAVESLDDPAARNKIIELGGPEALSPLEVVKIFEELGGRKFEVQLVPEEALASVAQKISAADDLQRAFAALLQTYAKGDPIDMRATLQKFPLQLTSVRDYARRMLSM
ncbi:MAG: SDR family NAD(P)-dependent oxidoreductase, partial [Bacteroidota bacterium]